MSAVAFPTISNGVNSGLVRLRTATMRLDWKDTDLVVGQDQLFFAPNSPTSFASLIVPALSYSGNLWAWTPQMRVEHRIAVSEKSTVTLQGGILDPLTGEPPYYPTPGIARPRRASGRGSRLMRDASPTRIRLFGHTFTIGTAGYYSRENWGYGRDVNGYAAMLDWSLPLDQWFPLSGSFYRGQAIGGLGGGIGRSVLYSGPLIDPTTSVLPLNTVGGWAQLKYRATSTLEFNAAFGQDNPFAADVRAFSDAAELRRSHAHSQPGNVRQRDLPSAVRLAVLARVSSPEDVLHLRLQLHRRTGQPGNGDPVLRSTLTGHRKFVLALTLVVALGALAPAFVRAGRERHWPRDLLWRRESTEQRFRRGVADARRASRRATSLR